MRDLKIVKAPNNRRTLDAGHSHPENSRSGELARVVWPAFKYYSQLKKLHSHVSEHPSETLSLKEAAGIASMEESYFSDFFHRNVGVPYKWWMDFIRIRRATKLIEDFDSSITEVALDSGFTDSTTFTRTFRRVIGITPRDYRRRVHAHRTR